MILLRGFQVHHTPHHQEMPKPFCLLERLDLERTGNASHEPGIWPEWGPNPLKQLETANSLASAMDEGTRKVPSHRLLA